jgi:signal transduction histidine kinase/ABC-type uncharacterized transport system substrate-binding protein
MKHGKCSIAGVLQLACLTRHNLHSSHSGCRAGLQIQSMEHTDLDRPLVSALCHVKRAVGCSFALVALALFFFVPVSQAQVRKKVLMINELGQSHPGPVIVTNTILSALHSDPHFHVEYYWENLDAVDLADEELNEQRDSLIERYQRKKLDLIVLMGPDPIRIVTDASKTLFPGVPVVFCCTAPSQVAQLVNRDPRSTGSWLQLEPAKTLDAALGLLPETRNVFVVGGASRYDRGLIALTKAGLKSYETRLNITYLNNLPMNELQERLRQLPPHSIVVYMSYFKDTKGQEFLNAVEALPMIIAASNAPVFGVSDGYIGRGIVGGFVVSFEEQGKIAARNVLDVLGGKPPKDIPVVQGPSVYQFDWRALQRWKLDPAMLPAGSRILFREPTFWERYKLLVLTTLLIILSLSLLTAYLLLNQKKLKRAQAGQAQLSGLLIKAQEQERSRVAAEIHDDFSQRLASLTLGIETTAQIIPESLPEARIQLQELSDAASELGADLHTLSHRLHSATLENLGLTPGISAFCREFGAQQGIKIDSKLDLIPRSVNPDVALCAFRIVQESLRNVKKHSGASSAQVSLKLEEATIHLTVCDQGVGFDRKKPMNSEGLGIRSMKERARLLGGRLEFESRVGVGTQIDAWLPMHPKSTVTTA